LHFGRVRRAESQQERENVEESGVGPLPLGREWLNELDVRCRRR
jgi:hypothetical protein